MTQTQFEFVDYELPKRPEREAFFDGPLDDESRQLRLGAQLDAIRELMLDGAWRTLEQIREATNFPPASISAQLRHLRKKRFGAYVVERRHLGRGLYEYRVSKPEEVSL